MLLSCTYGAFNTMHLVVPPKLKSIVLSKKKQLSQIFSPSYVLEDSISNDLKLLKNSLKQMKVKNSFLTFCFLCFPVKRIL